VPTIDLEMFRALRGELAQLRARISETESRLSADLGSIHEAYQASARNLVHYLVARQVDLRPLQLELWRRGLSSLGRIEGHVADALDRVIERLDDALFRAGRVVPEGTRPTRVEPSCDTAEVLLHQHTRSLFGQRPADRHVYVMVTAPSACEVNETWVSRLLDAGVSLLRVNGAHEDTPQWRHIIETARRVAANREAPLRILFDLPGPKLRTVAPGPGPSVERWKPQRDDFGRVVTPCRILLRREDDTMLSVEEPGMNIPATLWAKVTVGDELIFGDARGKKRHVLVAERGECDGVGLLFKTAYVIPETEIKLLRGGDQLGEFRVRRVVDQPFQLQLALGERLRLAAPALLPALATAGLPVIGCSLPDALGDLEVGARVLFDDGKIECVVETCDDGGAVLRVTHAIAEHMRLGGEKGINFPGKPLRGPSLSDEDERALAFAVTEADLIGASFVRDQQDVRALYARLDALGALGKGVVLKIETPAAFSRMPEILLEAMTRHPIGVMIARGDLAVEAGFERLAELQEEILWLCEAAHLPVIWATQVLDRLAHTGTATRAEVTDAAMAVRAECVMLNKGPYIVEAVAMLVDILRRMESHQYKKRSLYRRLRLELPHLATAPSGTSSFQTSSRDSGGPERNAG
jgi:pyruvate kinase